MQAGALQNGWLIGSASLLANQRKIRMETNSPIFVVGMNGSGTSALIRSLDQHTDIYAFPGESHIFLNYMRRFPDPIVPLPRNTYLKLLDDVSKDGGLIRWNGQQNLPLSTEIPDVPSLAAALDAAFCYFAQRDSKSRWCEKTPRNALYIRNILAHFPAAKIVHVIRDGRDAALSFQRRFGFSPLLSVYKWKKLVREARTQGLQAGPEKYLEIHYEKLTESPEEVLRLVCEFLNVDFEPDLLAPKRPNKKPTLAKSFVANSGKWQALSAAQIGQMEAVSGAELKNQGYVVRNSQGDADLARVQIFFLELLDGLKATRRKTVSMMSRDSTLKDRLNALWGLAKSSLAGRRGKF